MESIRAKTIKSGEEDEYFWIGFQIETDFNENDNLLILCGKFIDNQDKELEMDSLYFERCKQLYSGYNLEQSILINKEKVVITFLKKGKEILEFSNPLIIDCSGKPKQWEKGIKYLTNMSELDWIKTIKIDL